MLTLDRSYDRDVQPQATCMGIAAGLHLLVLLWNPTLLKKTLQTWMPPREKPPIILQILPEPLPLPAPVPLPRHPQANPVAAHPHALPAPAPLLFARPVHRWSIGAPPISHPEEALQVSASPLILSNPAPDAVKLHVGAAPLIQGKHPLQTLEHFNPLPKENFQIAHEDMIAPHAIVHTDPGPPIEGPASGLRVLKRQLPAYPSWAEEQGAVGVVRLRFSVTAQGAVRSSIQVIRTSGYDALDRLAIDALRQWLFAPVATVDDNQWGIITFTFSLTGG